MERIWGDRREGCMMGKGDRRKGDPGNGKGDGDPGNGEGDRGGYDGFADFEMSYISDIVDSAFCLGDILLSLIPPLFPGWGLGYLLTPFFRVPDVITTLPPPICFSTG